MKLTTEEVEALERAMEYLATDTSEYSDLRAILHRAKAPVREGWLTREQIENYGRHHSSGDRSATLNALCDMALAALDAHKED